MSSGRTIHNPLIFFLGFSHEKDENIIYNVRLPCFVSDLLWYPYRVYYDYGTTTIKLILLI
jgi:hypothetical protein